MSSNINLFQTYFLKLYFGCTLFSSWAQLPTILVRSQIKNMLGGEIGKITGEE